MHCKYIFLILICTFPLLAKDGLIPVSYEHYDKKIIISSHIHKSDSATFEVASNDYRWKLLNGKTQIDTIIRNRYVMPKLRHTGQLRNGVRIKKWLTYDLGKYDTLPSYKNGYSSSGRHRYRIDYTVEKPKRFLFFKVKGNRVKAERRTFYHPYMEEYKGGIDVPLLFGYSRQLGFTAKLLNLYAEIPSRRFYFARPTVVLSTDVGSRGYTFNLGLSPFSREDPIFSQKGSTPISLNASLSYIQKEEGTPDFLSDRWYWGANVDWHNRIGQVRLGAVQLVGPEENKEWQFTFSVGAGLYAVGILFWGGI